jgi:hypothetical protein
MRWLRAAEEKSCEAERDRTVLRPCRPSGLGARLGTALWRGAAMSGDGEAGGGDAAVAAVRCCDSKLRRTDNAGRHVTEPAGSVFLRGQLNGHMRLHGFQPKRPENGRRHARLSTIRVISMAPWWLASLLASESSGPRRNDYLVSRICGTWSAPEAAIVRMQLSPGRPLGGSIIHNTRPPRQVAKILPTTR